MAGQIISHQAIILLFNELIQFPQYFRKYGGFV